MSLLSVVKTGSRGVYVPSDNHRHHEKRRSSSACKTNAFIYFMIVITITIIIIIIDNKRIKTDKDTDTDKGSSRLPREYLNLGSPLRSDFLKKIGHLYEVALCKFFSDCISIRTYGSLMLRNLPLKQRPVYRGNVKLL